MVFQLSGKELQSYGYRHALYINVPDVFIYRKFLQQIVVFLKKKQSHKLTGANWHSSLHCMQRNLQQLKVTGGRYHY